MNKTSAGLLVFRRKTELEILLVHPGGPYWKRKDLGAWSIPKGEYTSSEDPLDVAKREFAEETGNSITGEIFTALSPVKLRSGKIIFAWAVEHDFETPFISSNSFEMEWPPKSGQIQLFPEVDKADWFNVAEAIVKVNPAQLPLIRQLESKLS